MNPSYTDWYPNDGTTRVAYLGSTGSGVLAFPPFTSWLTCGKTYALEAAYHYTDPGNTANNFRYRIGYNLPASANGITPYSFWCGY